MFDTVYINRDKLPISQEEKENFNLVHNFQTKDLECVLDNIYIGDDDKVKIYSTGYCDDNKDKLKSNEYLFDKDSAGELYFYGNDNKHTWWEFRAIFKHEFLISIEKLLR